MSLEPEPKTRRPAGSVRNGDLAIPVLACATGVLVTAEFIVVGLLPALAGDLAVSLNRAGWLVSAFALSAAVMGPVVTLMVTGIQPRLVLALGLVVFGLSGMIAALLPSFTTMVVARLVQGAILTPFISVANTAAASMAREGRTGRAIGQVNLGTVVATVFAVPAGVALAELFGWQAVFAGLSLFALAVAGVIPATVPRTPQGLSPSLRGQAAILRHAGFLLHLALSALLFTAMFAAYSYIAPFLQDVVGLSGPNVALALLGFGLAGLAGNWAASQMVDRNPTRLTVIVTVLLVLAAAAMPLAGGIAGLVIPLLALWGAAHTAAFVTCQVRVMFAAPGAPAFASSLNISVSNVGIAAGAILGGWVISRFGIALIGVGTIAAGVVALMIGLLLYVQGFGTAEAKQSPRRSLKTSFTISTQEP